MKRSITAIIDKDGILVSVMGGIPLKNSTTGYASSGDLGFDSTT